MRALALVLALTAPALACDFCMGGGAAFTPLQRDVAANANVALGELVGRIGEGRVRFAVTSVLKGTAEKEVTLDVAMFFLPRVTYLLVGKQGAERAIPLESSGVRYVKRVLAEPPPAKGRERLLWFLPYVAERDRLVAASARQEFAEAPYAEVKKLRRDLDAQRLVAWLESRSTPRQSRGTLLLLLGVSGSQGHIGKLEGWVKDADLQRKPSYDALIAAYLLLRGPEGLPLVEAQAGKQAESGRALVGALGFLSREEKWDVLPVLRALLRYPSFADATVAELLRRKDWDSVDRVIALYRAHPSVEKPVRAYLEACPRPQAADFLKHGFKRG